MPLELISFDRTDITFDSLAYTWDQTEIEVVGPPGCEVSVLWAACDPIAIIDVACEPPRLGMLYWFSYAFVGVPEVWLPINDDPAPVPYGWDKSGIETGRLLRVKADEVPT
jgi:hypothetical protein